MNISEMTLSFIIALIVKDFYDIFIKDHIRKILSKYKINIALKEKKNVE